MMLRKIAESQPDQQVKVDRSHELSGLAIFRDAEPIGKVKAVLVDEANRLHLIIDRGFWIFGKRVLLSADRTRTDFQARRIYLEGMSKQQVEDLPEYQDLAIGKGNRLQVSRMAALEESMPLEAADLLVAAAAKDLDRPTSISVTPDPIAAPDPPLLAAPVASVTDIPATDIRQPHHKQPETFKLYEERLTADKHLQKAGEVNVSKRVETQTTRVVVPIEKERVIIARHNPGKQGRIVPGARLQAGEVLRWEIYEETVEMQKQPVVREVVNIHKQTEQEIVQLEEPIRREVLDVQTYGHPTVEPARLSSSISNSNSSQ